jgi:hypothetical protein
MTIETNTPNFNKTRSTDIGLADVLLSFHLLSPTSEKTKKVIANALGFDWEYAVRPNHVETIITPKTDNKPEVPPTEKTITKDETIDSSPDITTLKPQQEVEDELVELFNVDWMGVESLAKTDIEVHFEHPNFVPLFNEKWFCGILSLILGTSIPTQEIDLSLVEKNIVNLLPIKDLPTRYRNSINRGVQIMLDVSESMQPFWRDEREIVYSLTGLLDKHRINVFEFEFETLPENSIVWRSNSPENIQTEIPILIITNFHTSNREKIWRIRGYEPLIRLFEEAKSKKCPVSILAPIPEEWFPADLKKFVKCSYVWDRKTSPQTVSRIKKVRS